MKNKKSILSLVFVLSIIVIGCNKRPDVYDVGREKDVAITYYDVDADFGQLLTYSIIDTVPLVEWGSDVDSLVWEASSRSSLIIDNMNAQMASLGYTKVEPSANPDILLNASILSLEIEYIGYYTSYPYYGWGGGYYWGYPDYGYYYPYYYPYYYTQSFGTVLMEMIDAKNINESTHQLRAVWTGMVVGSTDQGGDIDSRITDGINDCFSQSPYLKK